jgi:hypothetical protein
MLCTCYPPPRVIGFVLPRCGCLIARITVCSIPRPKRLCAAEVFSAVSGSGASIFFEAGARAGVGANSLTAGAPSESDTVSEFCEEGTGFVCDYSLQGCPSVRQRQADSVAIPPRGRHVRSAGNLTRRIGNRHSQERGNGCGRMRRCALTPSCDSKSLPVNHGDLFRRETPPPGVSLLLLPTRFKWRLRFRIIRGWWQVCGPVGSDCGALGVVLFVWPHVTFGTIVAWLGLCSLCMASYYGSRDRPRAAGT